MSSRFNTYIVSIEFFNSAIVYAITTTESELHVALDTGASNAYAR